MITGNVKNKFIAKCPLEYFVVRVEGLKEICSELCRLLVSDCKINLPSGINSSMTASLKKLLELRFYIDTSLI